MKKVLITASIMLAFSFPVFAQTYSITVTKTGVGSGVVYDDKGPYLHCGNLCTASYPAGTTVTLFALAEIESQFYGWSGPCSGTGDCVITLTANVTVTAHFGCLNGMETWGGPCGLNGRGIETGRCIEGVWEFSCIDPDQCVAGSRECEENIFKHCEYNPASDAYEWVITECVDNKPCTEDLCDTNKGCIFDPALREGTLCRDNVEICDEPEYCDGVNAECPFDLKKNGNICRGITEPCDLPEYCDGSHDECPADLVAGTDFLCRMVNGECDIEEYCDGEHKFCPADAFVAAGVECRAKDGNCDVAEVCPGDGPDCPDDAVATTEVECRSATDLCDAAEYCDGVSKSCPPDALKTTADVCRPSTGTCDATEYCNGSSKECPPENYTTTNGLACVDAYDYTGNETCANGICTGPEVIGSCSAAYSVTSYPYTLDSTTVGRPSHITAYGANCPVTDAPLGDAVVRFPADAGVTYTISIIRHGGWTGFMAIIPICSIIYTNATCLNQDATADSFTYTPLLGGNATLVIESLSGTGDFTLTIEREETPQPDDLVTDDDIIVTDELIPDEELPDEIVVDDVSDDLVDEEESDDATIVTDDGFPLVDDTVKPDDAPVMTDDSVVLQDKDTVTPTDNAMLDNETSDEVTDELGDALLGDEDTVTMPDDGKKPKEDGCGCSVVF